VDTGKVKRVASVLLLALALVGAAAYVYARHERFSVILDVPPAAVATLLAGGLLFRALEGTFLRMVVNRLGGDIAFGESQLLSWATAYWNLLPVKPGTGALGVYLKRRHGLPYSSFLAYLLTMNVMRLLVNAVLGLVVSLPLCLWRGLTPIVPGLFGLLLAGCITVTYLPTGWQYAGENRILRAIANTGRAWQRMRRMRGLLWRIGLWRFACGFVAGLTVLVSFRAVGVQAGYLQAVIVMELCTLSRFATLVPAQLGVREALSGIAGMSFGFAFSDGVVAAALGRAVVMPLLVALGPLASWWLHRRTGIPAVQDAVEDARP